MEDDGVKIIESQGHKTFCNGFCGGMHDGIIENVPDAPKTPHLLEIKTSNRKYFIPRKKNGVRNAKPDHYLQMQIYMHLWKLKRALYICTCKDDDSRHYERIEYDPTAAKLAITRAENIVKSETPPPRVANTPDDWPCLNCDFKSICHMGDKINKTCRSCKHLDLHDGGVWHCSKKGKDRDKKQQEKGCKKWKRIQGL